MKTFLMWLALLVAVTGAGAAQLGVTYDSVTRNVSPTNGNIGAASAQIHGALTGPTVANLQGATNGLATRAANLEGATNGLTTRATNLEGATNEISSRQGGSAALTNLASAVTATNGFVGIGNPAPLSMLSVSNNTATAASFRVFPSNNPTPAFQIASNGAASFGTASFVTGARLTLAGGPVLFLNDNTDNIGAVGANRPSSVYIGDTYFGSHAVVTGTLSLGSGQPLIWTGASRIIGGAGGVIRFANSGDSDFNRGNLGGTTAAFPAIGRTNGDVIILGANGAFDGTSTNKLRVPGGIVAGAATWSGNQLYSADNTYDIGAVGATRPRFIYTGTGANFAGLFQVSSSSGNSTIHSSFDLNWGSSALSTPDVALRRIGVGKLLMATNLVAQGSITATNGYFYPTNIAANLPSAANIGTGGYWIGNSNGVLVALYSIDGAATIMKILAP